MYTYNSQLKPTGLLPSVQVYRSATRFPFFHWSIIIHHQHPQHPVVVFHQPIWKMLARQIGSFQTWNPNFAGWKFKNKNFEKTPFHHNESSRFLSPKKPFQHHHGVRSRLERHLLLSIVGGNSWEISRKNTEAMTRAKECILQFFGFQGIFLESQKILSHHGNPKQKLCICYYFFVARKHIYTNNQHVYQNSEPTLSSPMAWDLTSAIHALSTTKFRKNNTRSTLCNHQSVMLLIFLVL